MSVILEQRCPICQSTKDFRPRLGMCSECRDDERLIKLTILVQDFKKAMEIATTPIMVVEAKEPE
jgi:hypothetical protein